MASERTNLKTPVGRIVMGNLYKANTTDAEGKPLTIKSGPNKDQPRVDYFFALAIPKGSEQHWAQTEWGAIIWAAGHKAFPQAAQSPAFAWKIKDGDSQIPNKKGKKPCDQEGFPGHWILNFSGGYAPKVYQQDGAGYVQVTQPDFIKPGYYVEVAGTVDGNGSANQPGVFVNHSMVCFRAFGPEIHFGPDVNEAGFGAAPLPAGASATPLASAVPLPGAPATPSAPPAIPSVPVAAVPTSVPSALPASVPVIPQPGFLQVPTPPAAVSVPTPPITVSAPPSRMTAKAQGATFEQFAAQGWTEAQLIAQGYMV